MEEQKIDNSVKNINEMKENEEKIIEEERKEAEKREKERKKEQKRREKELKKEKRKEDRKEFRENTKEILYKYRGWAYWSMALIATAVLGYFDYLSMIELFTNSNLLRKDVWKFAMLFAICLEGIPFFSAYFVAKVFVHHKVKKNDRRYAGIGFVLGMIGLLIAWGVAMYIRGIIIQNNILEGKQELYRELMVFLEENSALDEAEAYFWKMNENRPKYDGYTVDIFLFWSPIMTSILAFLASWSTTAKDVEKEVKQEVEFYHKKFLKKEADYRAELEKLLNLRASIWHSVTQYEAERVPMPVTENAFREEVIRRIRKQLISNSVTVYPSEVGRFQNKVEAELREYLSELAANSTNPEIILSIDIQEIIRKYDEEQLRNNQEAKCWDYSKAGTELEAELRRLVDNTTIMVHSSKAGAKK